MVRYARSRGTRELAGDVLHANTRMLALAKGAGFEVAPSAEPGAVRIRLPLRETKT
jgi:acetyltransferase